MSTEQDELVERLAFIFAEIIDDKLEPILQNMNQLGEEVYRLRSRYERDEYEKHKLERYEELRRQQERLNIQFGRKQSLPQFIKEIAEQR